MPRNDEIKAAGDPDQIDVAAVRGHFNEARWLASNHFRTVATTLAFGCLAWALVLLGRVDASRPRPRRQRPRPRPGPSPPVLGGAPVNSRTALGRADRSWQRIGRWEGV